MVPGIEKATYPEVGEAAFGKVGRLAAWFGMLAMTLGVCGKCVSPCARAPVRPCVRVSVCPCACTRVHAGAVVVHELVLVLFVPLLSFPHSNSLFLVGVLSLSRSTIQARTLSSFQPHWGLPTTVNKTASTSAFAAASSM